MKGLDRVTGNGVERRKKSRDQKEMELAEPIPEFVELHRKHGGDKEGGGGQS